MVCGADWKHLASLHYAWIYDEIGIYSWGFHGEVCEGETLFTAIALALGEVEVGSPNRTPI